MTCCQSLHRARVFQLFDARPAGHRPLTTGADGAFHNAILRWIVSRASGVDSAQARIVRISSTLSRDTIELSAARRYTTFLAHRHAQHEGERGDVPERQRQLLPGETARKRLAIPMFMGRVT